MRLLAACLLLFSLLGPAWATEPDRRIAITIDDLPWQWPARLQADTLAQRHARLIAALRASGVTGVGFVNEGKLDVEGTPDPVRVAMLRDWLDAGWELGNHTFGHVDFHVVGLDAFEADTLRGERHLRPLLQARGTTPRWFRHPYLRAGRTPEDRQAFEAFLAEHGYRVAPVTVDNGEWVWAAAYQRVMDGNDAQRDAALERLRRGYVPYLLNKLDYYERQSQALLGYALPQVLLLHANELNAEMFPALVDAIQRRGYRVIGLEEALRDPAYARPDGYRGRYGPSWLHRWAMAEGKPRTFYAGEPEVPKWVLDLAGVDSE